MITDAVIITNSPASTGSNSSVRVQMAIPAEVTASRRSLRKSDLPANHPVQTVFYPGQNPRFEISEWPLVIQRLQAFLPAGSPGRHSDSFSLQGTIHMAHLLQAVSVPA